MINVTKADVVFNVSGRQLDQSIRLALDSAATTLTTLYSATDVDLETVTAKANLRLIYVKYVRLCTLVRNDFTFDESYVLDAFKANGTRFEPLDEDGFYRLTLAEREGNFRFRPSYLGPVQSGLGFFLIALHSGGAITLPYSFNWPFVKSNNGTRIEIAPFIASELLQLVRSVYDSDSLNAAALQSVTTHHGRKSWFLSNGTKLLLALGWNRPEDANLDDLLKVKEANDATDFSGRGAAMAYRALVDVLERKYGNRCAVSVRAWDAALISAERLVDKTSRLFGEKTLSINLDQALEMRPSDAFPERLLRLSKLPGLAVDFAAMRQTWLELQATYLRKLRRESPKEHQRALGYLNLYLFFYLPYWFNENSDTRIRYPTTPSELLTSVFISRLVHLEFSTPLTYLEFVEKYGERQGWAPVTRHHALQPLRQFFEFLGSNSHELPGCQGFVQPLSKHDFPAVGRLIGTNKRPVPRRLFSFYLAYVETLVTYTHVVLDRILSGKLSGDDDLIFIAKRTVIDTVRATDKVGYVPMVFFRGRGHRIQFLPNCMDLETFRLKDGRTLRIPQPHGLHHVLVAIYTGIRNQHIQWLDARTFDSKVHPDDVSITKLLVNTDKVMTKCWEPHVNVRVIQILREQLRWRNLIDCAGFDKTVYYEGNEKTKWPAIQPLFAVTAEGYPHPDSRYATVWDKILMGVQGMASEIDCGRIPPLFELLPEDVPYKASDRRDRLNAYRGSLEPKIALHPKSDITPHSARVGVVSHLITVLPAEFIGKYVTGQHTSVVYHYVRIDEDDIRASQAEQAVALAVGAYGKQFDELLANGQRPNPIFLKADHVNSAFAKSLRRDFEATLASYGCVTLSLREGGKSGIDVLRETRGADAAFNKTEVCPFGNHCPPDVLKDLRGIGRCALCPYAVRSIDHLPAVVAKIKQVTEQLESVEQALDRSDFDEVHTDTERQEREAERQRLGDELAGWKLSSEVLEVQRRLIESGQDSRRWVVAKPEIIEQALRRIPVPTGETAYVLARLAESVAYPTFDSPEIKGRFDLLRRQLLANVGNVRAALTSPMPPDLTAQCAGLLRTFVEANGLDYSRVLSLLTKESHLQNLGQSSSQLLLEGI